MAFFSTFKANKGWSSLSQTASVGSSVSTVIPLVPTFVMAASSPTIPGPPAHLRTLNSIPSAESFWPSPGDTCTGSGDYIGASFGPGDRCPATTRRGRHGCLYSRCKHLRSTSCMPSRSRCRGPSREQGRPSLWPSRSPKSSGRHGQET